jgi:hypothetical protein
LDGSSVLPHQCATVLVVGRTVAPPIVVLVAVNDVSEIVAGELSACAGVASSAAATGASAAATTHSFRAIFSPSARNAWSPRPTGRNTGKRRRPTGEAQ